ncbi:MAG: caspase family protein [Phormidesmis sp.]
MANHWAITIGINQYRHLQPLMHAQNDALYTYRFLVEEAGFPRDHCVLLSDLAVSVGQQAVYPDKPALLEWVRTITQQVKEGDVLWFFFSGYGAQLEGEDFLMPIDGDPAQIASTGLAMSALMESLAQLPTGKVLALLDINRAQGSLAGQAIGQPVIELAKKHGVATLLSCLPEQYSHETFGTRHGLFTAALLEALQQKCTTIGQISDYLARRLPEICDHHWRPIQNPASVIDDNQRSMTVVSEAGVIADVTAKGASDAPLLPVERPASEPLSPLSLTKSSAEPFRDEDSDVMAGAGAAAGVALEPPPPAADIATINGSPSARDIPGPVPLPIPSSGSREVETLPADGRPTSDENGTALPSRRESSSGVSGARLRNWGLLALALLVVGVVLKQPFVTAAWQGLTERLSPLTADRTVSPDGDDNIIEDAAAGSTATELPAGSVNSAGEVEPATAQTPNSGETVTSNSPPTEAEQAEALIARAQAALAQRQYSEALIALQRVPQSQRNDAFSSVLTQARAGAAAAQQANASVLTEARTAIQPIQAFQFTEAIAKARLIKPGEPYYETAQEDIRAWSQIILDVAEGRATSGDLEGAIAAATIMPYDNAQLYEKAQERIGFWQQRQRSREIIAQAQAIPVSGQASSYQEGIVKLQEVPIEHPEYETAQRLADDWSERIFSIAQARAAQGRQEAAVQAAILVPAGTAAYEPAQQAIRRWQAETVE